MRIVVGGETRKCGKTTVVCRILAGFADQRWTAVKISPHMHADGEGAWSLREDAAAGDTMRYKQSGAARAYLFCGDAEAGRAALLDVLNTAGHWIVETTSAARLIPHDLALLVAAPSGRAAKGAAGFPPHIRVGLSDAGLADLVRQHWKA